MSSFLPVPRLGLVNPEGYIAFSLFPHLSAIPLDAAEAVANYHHLGLSLVDQILKDLPQPLDRSLGAIGVRQDSRKEDLVPLCHQPMGEGI